MWMFDRAECAAIRVECRRLWGPAHSRRQGWQLHALGRVPYGSGVRNQGSGAIGCCDEAIRFDGCKARHALAQALALMRIP
jgi:hypothetical protein